MIDEKTVKKRRNAYDPEVSARYREYRNTYMKNNLKTIPFRVNKTSEEGQKILKHLEGIDNVNEYLRNLILSDMKKQKSNTKRDLKKNLDKTNKQ